MSNILPRTKSRGVAAILALLFPPFGLVYSTIKGFLFMLLLAPIIWIVLISLCLIFKLEGAAVTIFILGIAAYVPICFILSIRAVNKFNEDIVRKSSTNISRTIDDDLRTDYNYYLNDSKNNSDTFWYFIGTVLLILLLIWGFYKRDNISYLFKKISGSVISFNNSKYLSGKYSCVNNCIYQSFEFKGESSVLVDGIFAASFVTDKNYVRIKTDKSDLLLKIQDENTLIGEGFATGTYIKNYKSPIIQKQNLNQETKKDGPVIENTILVDLKGKKVSARKISGFTEVNNENYKKPMTEQYFVFVDKKIYLIENEVPIKVWNIIHESLEEEEEVLTTKENDTFYIFGDISISDKNNNTVNYSCDYAEIKDVKIAKEYLTK